MLLAQHLTALRAWSKLCLSGRGNTDVLRAGIAGMRGRVYGHRTTVMRNNEYTLLHPSTPHPLLCVLVCIECTLTSTLCLWLTLI